jgi:hypothetical protein
MEVTQYPQQKLKRDESISQFQQRIYGDILSRPANYFKKFNREKKAFGMKFWRTEFDLEETNRTDEILSREISECIKNDDWYKKFSACYNPDQCNYLPVCESGHISELLFDDKEKV